jgi:Hemerythrin HHE cation binding domain
MKTGPTLGAPSHRSSPPSPAPPPIDFTMMYATHSAFRRDLSLLGRAAPGGAVAPVRARWGNFKAQLLVHHSVEDEHLWPRVRVCAGKYNGASELLDDMEREHHLLEPLLDAVDRAMSAPPRELVGSIRRLQEVLTAHLDHEERDALPLIQAVCTGADWRDFAGHMARRQGISGAAVYVPWALEGLGDAERRQFLRALPAPVRVLSRLAWEPRYRRRARQSTQENP